MRRAGAPLAPCQGRVTRCYVWRPRPAGWLRPEPRRLLVSPPGHPASCVHRFPCARPLHRPLIHPPPCRHHRTAAPRDARCGVQGSLSSAVRTVPARASGLILSSERRDRPKRRTIWPSHRTLLYVRSGTSRSYVPFCISACLNIRGENSSNFATNCTASAPNHEQSPKPSLACRDMHYVLHRYACNSLYADSRSHPPINCWVGVSCGDWTSIYRSSSRYCCCGKA